MSENESESLSFFVTKGSRTLSCALEPEASTTISPSNGLTFRLLGSKFEGSPITPETQPPLVHKLKKNKEADLVPYQLYFKAGLHTKQMMIMYTDIN